MSGTPVPTTLDIVAQTPRRLRYSQVRSLNTIDYVLIGHNAYESADVPHSSGSPDAAKWGPAIAVQGYDKVALFVDFTDGDSNRDLLIDTQVSYDGSVWFDRKCSFDILTGAASNQTIASRQLLLEDEGKCCFEVQTIGHFMRFQPHLKTGASANSRCTIMVMRVMNSE